MTKRTITPNKVSLFDTSKDGKPFKNNAKRVLLGVTTVAGEEMTLSGFCEAGDIIPQVGVPIELEVFQNDYGWNFKAPKAPTLSEIYALLVEIHATLQNTQPRVAPPVAPPVASEQFSQGEDLSEMDKKIMGSW